MAHDWERAPPCDGPLLGGWVGSESDSQAPYSSMPYSAQVPERLSRDDPIGVADRSNGALMAAVRKRADDPGGVLGPCLRSYDERLRRETAEHPLLNLTRHLVDTFPETSESIRARMAAKWAVTGGSADDIQRSVTNSFRRSAGTNYQGLVSYALARHLSEIRSSWYLQHPVPPIFRTELAIRFTAGIQGPGSEERGSSASEDGDDDGQAEPIGVVVKPDLDILVRNAGWRAGAAAEPVLVLSVKTSLADRAGMAARWKTYFDLVTQPCPHVDDADCAYKRLGIELAGQPNLSITHGIVTANIYKMNSDAYYTEFGELAKEQARSNTFMFDLRYSTRNENEKVMTPEWAPLTDILEWLSYTSRQHSLPL